MTNVGSSNGGGAFEWRAERGLLDAHECCGKGRLPDAPELRDGAGGHRGSLDKGFMSCKLRGVGGGEQLCMGF